MSALSALLSVILFLKADNNIFNNFSSIHHNVGRRRPRTSEIFSSRDNSNFVSWQIKYSTEVDNNMRNVNNRIVILREIVVHCIWMVIFEVFDRKCVRISLFWMKLCDSFPAVIRYLGADVCLIEAALVFRKNTIRCVERLLSLSWKCLLNQFWSVQAEPKKG